jgi:hypothetical protein
MTVTKNFLSNSTNGKNVTITSTAFASPTLIHTAVAGTTDQDEVWVWAFCTAGTTAQLNMQLGSANHTDKCIIALTPTLGPQLVIPGVCYNNEAAISAWTDITGAVAITGFVNKIVN